MIGNLYKLRDEMLNSECICVFINKNTMFKFRNNNYVNFIETMKPISELEQHWNFYNFNFIKYSLL